MMCCRQPGNGPTIPLLPVYQGRWAMVHGAAFAWISADHTEKATPSFRNSSHKGVIDATIVATTPQA
jgi:hypothetical protein